MKRVFTEVKEICFKGSPSEDKVQQVPQKIFIISEKQNDIIMKLTQAGNDHGEKMKELMDDMHEKLKHSMFMIQQM